MKRVAMIQNIDINSLHPHPDNPRKDLGDLVELAESIKARGIMQNLTVTPGHEMSAAKWIELSREYQKKPTEELREQINNRFEQDGYTVVIGHRRLAAAKLAGLEKLPCAVVEMTKKEQVATMLLENMQRADLTVYEQAQGFQMMLNFGETVQDIAEKTGFSKTTIRHRTKLLELDPEKFKESAAREVTLADYIKLEQIKDIDLRNGVLESIDANNFDWELREAINHEEYKERKAVWAAALKEFAEEIKSASIIYTQGKQIVGNYSLNQSIELLDVPEDADTVNYFYQISAYGDVRIYQEGTMNEVDYQQTPENIVLTKFNNAAEHAYKLRQDFVKNYKGAKSTCPLLWNFGCAAG
ncbi:MAG: ParB/RepB/Spo0J family partition protein [Candidatus Syntrophopropionicum ammoniitolerans]